MFELNLYLTLKKHKGDTKENVDEHQKQQPNFKVGDQVWFQWQHIKTIRPLQKLDHQKLYPLFIVKQINAMPFQFKFLSSMKIHLVFYVSLLEPYHTSIILERIHDLLPPIEVDGE
jgi:hypothetical protein